MLNIIQEEQILDVGKMAYIVGSMSYPFEEAERICKKFYNLTEKYPEIYQNEKLAKRIDGIVKNCSGGYINLNIFRVTGKIEHARLELYKMYVELAEEEELKYSLETWSSKSKNMRVYGVNMSIY